MRRVWGKRPRAAWLGALIAAMAISAPAADAIAAPPGRGMQATIRWTAHGIPHILARSYSGVGFGYGYAIAQQNICQLADSYVTVAGQRSLYFGPDASWRFYANGTTNNNLDSDFFFGRIIADRTVEKLLAKPAPLGPRREVRALVRGYVAGYNAYLRRTGRDRIDDPRCRGAAWVRPIRAIDAYRRFYALALLASSGVAIDGIGGAQPPTAGLSPRRPSLAEQRRMLGEVGDRIDLLGGLGSNAYALGRKATRSGRGMVLGNPHFPWDGAERFFEAHLTIPGKLDVSGATLYGAPLVVIGHTRHLAWSHTVSPAFRFTPFEETLVPGSPTTYLVDGMPEEMKRTTVTVRVKGTDGSLGSRTRTLYATRHGPILTSILGLPLFPWTPLSAYSVGDANATNFRLLNHFFEADHAQSTGQLLRVLERNQGIPWVHTLAADSRGRALYADISVVPHVTDAQAASCNTALGIAAFAQLRLPVLDGKRTECDWGSDRDSRIPGIFGPSSLPHLFRDDYVTNSNDSYWLANPAQPLEGFPRIVGNERGERSLRTRLGLKMVQQRLAGTDGLPGRRFTLRLLQKVMFNDRNNAGELMRNDLAAYCEANPVVTTSGGPVDVAAACPVLRRWNMRDNLDSRGAVLFRLIADGLLLPATSAVPGENVVGGGSTPPNTWTTPFSVDDPVNTPRYVNTSNPLLPEALGGAVAELRKDGIPLDAPLRGYQSELRGKRRIPIHGGPGDLGVFNNIEAPFRGAEGFPDVVHGSSFVMAVELRRGCPEARTIVTYSQSSNPRSPFYGDQTRLFSRKRWVDVPFCEAELRRDPSLRVVRVSAR